MKPTVAGNETEIWSRAIRPEIGDVPTGAAREFLRLGLASEDLARVAELSGKAHAATLTVEETQELDYYLNVGRALEFLKAKARFSLRNDALAATAQSGQPYHTRLDSPSVDPRVAHLAKGNPNHQ